MSDFPSHEDVRRSRIRDVVGDYWERHSRGESIDARQLTDDNPDLMPELAEELKKQRLVAKARIHFEQREDASHHVTEQLTDGSIETARLSVRCPHCSNSVEILADVPWSDITCVGCGNVFSLVSDRLTTREAPSLKRVGHFELIERIGVGGFGTVWKARDTILDRTVALKLPRRGQLTEEEIDKFLREARAAAQLRHPNIVSVHEVGRCDDTVYIVSDLVRGVSLSDWMAIRMPSPVEAAQLCGRIARALDHAHQAGIVHRDLKPGNIMVDADDQPHIMDFGLAKRDVGEITMTIEGQVIGTPAYMAPEQARGQSHLSSPRTDVYSLGVILFELMTGELPFRGNTNMLLHQVLNDEPPNPRKLNNHIPMDLETICLRCLEKDPLRRFESAGALADELSRALEQQPILSRPVGTLERTVRWCLRHQTTAGLMAATLLALIAGTAVSTYFALLAAGFRGEAEESQREVQRASQSFATETSSFFALGSAQLRTPYNRQLQAASAIWRNHPDAALAMLEDAVRCPEAIRDFTWKYYHRNSKRPVQLLRIADGAPRALTFSVDAKSLFAVDSQDVRRRWTRTQGGSWKLAEQSHVQVGKQALAILPTNGSVIFQANGRLVQLASHVETPEDVVGHELFKTHNLIALVSSHDGARLFGWLRSADGSASDQWIRIDLSKREVSVLALPEFATTDVMTRQHTLDSAVPLLQVEEAGEGSRVLIGMSGQVAGIWSDDESRWISRVESGPTDDGLRVGSIASGGEVRLRRGTVQWIDTANSQPVDLVPAWLGKIHTVAQTNDRSVVAMASIRGAVAIWDTEARNSKELEIDGKVTCFEFAADSPRLAAATESAIRLINLETGQDIAEPILLSCVVKELAWAPDGSAIAFRGDDDSVGYVSLAGERAERQIDPSRRYSTITFSRDNRLLLGTHTGELLEWNSLSPDAKVLSQFSESISDLAYCRGNGAIFVAFGNQFHVLRDGHAKLELSDQSGAAKYISVSKNGDCVLSVSDKGVVTRWRINWTNGRYRAENMATTVTGLETAEISPDGQTIATLKGSRVHLWDGRTGEFRGVIESSSPLVSARFVSLPIEATSQLMTCDATGKMARWSGHSLVRTPTSYPNGVQRALAVVATPRKENLLLSAGDCDSVSLFTDRMEHRNSIWHGDRSAALAAADGNGATRIAVSCWNGCLCLFETDNEREAEWREKYRWDLNARCDQLAMSSDARWLIAILSDGSLKAWNLEDGRVLETPDARSWSPISLAINTSNSTCLLGTSNGGLMLLRLEGDKIVSDAKQADLQRLLPPIVEVAALSNGSWASMTADGRLTVHDSTCENQLAEVSVPDGVCLAAHPSRLEMAVGTEGSIYRWSLTQGQLRRVGQPWSEHEGRITDLIYARDGSTLISASEDRSLKAWNLEPGTLAKGVPPIRAEGRSTDVIPPAVKALFESQGAKPQKGSAAPKP